MKAAAKAHAPFALKLALTALLIVGVGFAAQLGWAHAQVSPQFALKAINVSGNARATDAELLRISGLAEGQNLFQLETLSAERSVASHPWVKTVEVTRHFPSRATIAITEHEPAAVVSLGELYLVDANALPFKRLQPQDELDLPLITGLDREIYTEHPLEYRARVLAALELLKVWKPAPAEIRTSVQGLSVVGTDGQEVRLGEGDLAAKLERLALVRKELSAKKLSADVIRLDNRMRPTWVTVQLSK